MSFQEKLSEVESIPAGRQAWHALRYNPLQKLEPADILTLQRKVRIALQFLPTEDYSSFCQAVNDYQEKYALTHDTSREVLLPGFPVWNQILKYCDDLSAKRRYKSFRTAAFGTKNVVTGLCFIVGALGAGSATDYYTESRLAAYLLSAAGGVASAGVGSLLMAQALAPFTKFIDGKNQQLEEIIESRTESLLIATAKTYLSSKR